MGTDRRSGLILHDPSVVATLSTTQTYEIAAIVLSAGLMVIAAINIVSYRKQSFDGIPDHRYYPLAIGLEISLAILQYHLGNFWFAAFFVALAILNTLLMLFQFGPPGLSFNLKSWLPRWSR